MPSRSQAEHRAMEGAAHDADTARKLGIPQKVAREFIEADTHSEAWKKRERAAQKAGMSPEIYDLIQKTR